MDESSNEIPVHITTQNRTQSRNRRDGGANRQNNKTVRRSNKAVQALILPSVANVNPRSVYNKSEEFVTFVTNIVQEGLDLTFISESFEKPEYTLESMLKEHTEMEDYDIVSNPHQRQGKGGRPAMVIKKGKYHIQNLTNTLLTIPWGVEAVWTLLTPINVSNTSIIQKIACCAFYSRPQSTAPQRAALLDHITESFHILSTKYSKGLHFIMAGDANRLRLDPILHLSPLMRSVVGEPTRLGEPGSAPAMLDPILTTLATYYQPPVVLPPLDPDPGSGGKPSDHMIPVMQPCNMIDNNAARIYREVTIRPMPQSGINQMIEWMIKKDWKEIIEINSVTEKAEVLQKEVMEKLEEVCPEKVLRIASDDQPWMTDKLKKIARKKERIFWKERRSERWKKINKLFQQKKKEAQTDFNKNMIEQMKSANPSKWYSIWKRISKIDEGKSDQIVVPDICHLTDQEQAEAIATKLQTTSNMYKPVEDDDIELPDIPQGSIPEISPAKVREYMQKLSIRKSTAKGDIPAKIIKECASFLCLPLSDIINASIKCGEWSDTWKLEIITPIPKCNPLKSIDDLRPIAIF